MKTVYLDNGATSFPKAPGVGEAMAAYIEKVGCNVSRGSYAPAYEAAGKLLEIRERLSGLLGGPGPRNLIFTPGATWGLNMLLKGCLLYTSVPEALHLRPPWHKRGQNLHPGRWKRRKQQQFSPLNRPYKCILSQNGGSAWQSRLMINKIILKSLNIVNNRYFFDKCRPLQID